MIHGFMLKAVSAKEVYMAASVYAICLVSCFESCKVGKLFRHTDVAKQLQKMCREADRSEDILCHTAEYVAFRQSDASHASHCCKDELSNKAAKQGSDGSEEFLQMQC